MQIMRAESLSQSQAFTGMKTRKVEKQNKTVNDWPENEMAKSFTIIQNAKLRTNYAAPCQGRN